MNIKNTLPSIVASILPCGLFLVGGGGLAVAYFVVGQSYAQKSLIYVIPIVLAGIILLFRSRSERISTPVQINGLEFVHLVLVTLFLFIISVVILIYYPTRPWAYFAVVALISGTIFAQILWRRPAGTDYLIIFEIVLLSLNLIWGVSLKYPLYFGDSDILVHLSYIDTVLQTGHISGLDTDYRNFPLFHIFNAIGSEVAGLSLRTSLFILSAVLWQAGTLFAYLIFNKLSNSRTFSLTACLLLAVSHQIVFHGMYAGTRPLAYVIVIGWLYLIIGRFDVKYVFLSLIALSAFILTHHTTVMFFIPIILLVYIFQRLFTRDKSGKSSVRLIPIELLTISFFSYLLYVATSFRDEFGHAMWQQMFTADISTNVDVVSGYTQGFGINIVYHSLVLFFTLIGIGLALKHHRSDREHQSVTALALLSLLFLVFFIPGPLNLIAQSQAAYLYRLPLLVSPFVIYIMAYCLSNLRYFKPFLAAGVIALITFFSIICGSNGSDNVSLSSMVNIGTQHFTDSELTLFTFVKGNCDSDSRLHGDFETMRNEYYFDDFSFKRIIEGADISSINEGYLIFRSGELRKTGGLNLAQSIPVENAPSIVYRYVPRQTGSQGDIAENLSEKQRVYSNGDVQVYMMTGNGDA